MLRLIILCNGQQVQNLIAHSRQWLSGSCDDAAPEEHEGDCPRAGQSQTGEGREETTLSALVRPRPEERRSLSSFDVKPQEREGSGETTPGSLRSEEARLEGKRKRPGKRQRCMQRNLTTHTGGGERRPHCQRWWDRDRQRDQRRREDDFLLHT